MSSYLGLFLYLLLFTATNTFGEEYIVRAKDLADVPGTILKKIDRNTYLVELESLPVGLKSLSTGTLIEKNYKLWALNAPNDPCLQARWDLNFIRAYQAWDISTGSRTIYVAVLDTGVDYSNPDLKDNVWKNPDEVCGNNIDDDGNGYVDDCYGIDVANGDSDPMDDNGHGTAIASVIGAVGNNETLIAGVNWSVIIIPCKFLDSSGGGTIAGEIECLNYILNLKRNKGLNIVAVNASYGNVYPDSEIQREKIRELANEGIMYVTAAGNEGANNDLISMNPCNYDLDNMLCVGSVNSTGDRSGFSNYGFNKVKLSAPGENILTLENNNSGSSCSDLTSLSGTSFSTPFVTGAVALFKSTYPLSSYTEVKKHLLTTGRNNLSLSGQTYTCNILDLYSLMNGAVSPKVCASTLSLDWGDVQECTTVEKELIIRNTGNQRVQVANLYLEGGGFLLTKDGCSGRLLDTFEECSVFLAFSPGGSGDYTGSMYIHFSDSGLDFSVSLHAASSSSCGKSGGCTTGNPWVAFIPVLVFLRLLTRLRRR
ncbi:subtilase family protein [Hydrogenivirga caldilitoris]|uniref:Subtilase family protein n=1 Tax=Hydrogenivirga caldilitoris TaxID=246264 RepID=A0A497XUD5_9AQUI|nr:S8 family serine peptidase [Hydrogenivirga caldilitoris]RLJ70752.1 subtilase family protein [Hydrogenivirga caldilitoris]